MEKEVNKESACKNLLQVQKKGGGREALRLSNRLSMEKQKSRADYLDLFARNSIRLARNDFVPSGKGDACKIFVD